MRRFPKNLFGRYFATTEKEPAMDAQPDPLDEIAIPAKTCRDVLVELLKDDWNTRKTVMHAKDGDTFNARYTFTATMDMAVAKRVLKELPPME